MGGLLEGIITVKLGLEKKKMEVQGRGSVALKFVDAVRMSVIINMHVSF